jgi:transcriptional regulator GlxA family with amidase domain
MTEAKVPTVGIILFEGAEELDWAGPWEVFTLAGTNGALRAVTVAESSPVRSAKGLRVLPDHSFDDAPPLDVIVVPGGLATREQVDNERLIGFLQERCPQADWVTSVCTGAILLEAAGQLDGRKATTHWAALDELAPLCARAVGDRRIVEQGKVVTAAGVSAGIDMALWLAARLAGDDVARAIQLGIEYDPQPPFDSGSTAKADPALVDLLRGMVTDPAPSS